MVNIHDATKNYGRRKIRQAELDKGTVKNTSVHLDRG